MIMFMLFQDGHIHGTNRVTNKDFFFRNFEVFFFMKFIIYFGFFVEGRPLITQIPYAPYIFFIQNILKRIKKSPKLPYVINGPPFGYYENIYSKVSSERVSLCIFVVIFDDLLRHFTH